MQIIRQLFDINTSTYTYIIASGYGREGIIIDPVSANTSSYINLLNELNLKLVMCVDTHTHADHVSSRCQLCTQTKCLSVMGEQTKAECISVYAKDGESIPFDGMKILPIYTPGHTDDSYSYLIDNNVFTGDTLFVRGTGRTDFQKGNPSALYDSITEKLFSLPESTIVYPGHDYNGNTVSSIYEEIRYNPRVANKSKVEFIDIMNSLNLKKPAMIDKVVPANLSCTCGL